MRLCQKRHEGMFQHLQSCNMLCVYIILLSSSETSIGSCAMFSQSDSISHKLIPIQTNPYSILEIIIILYCLLFKEMTHFPDAFHLIAGHDAVHAHILSRDWCVQLAQRCTCLRSAVSAHMVLKLWAWQGLAVAPAGHDHLMALLLLTSCL